MEKTNFDLRTELNSMQNQSRITQIQGACQRGYSGYGLFDKIESAEIFKKGWDNEHIDKVNEKQFYENEDYKKVI